MSLRECPFCGSKEVAHEYWAQFARCGECKAEGPYPDPDGTRWNTRAPDPRIAELEESLARFQKLDAQAATYVETLIIQRCPNFTGEEPYVGWEGLGLALGEWLDELEAEVERLSKEAS